MKKVIISISILLVVFLYFGWKRENAVMLKLGYIDKMYEIKCKLQQKQAVVVGMARKHLCVDIYSDGGKPCSDGSECISDQCVWTSRYKGDKAGYCKYNAAPNCFGEQIIHNGKKENTISICD